MKDANQQSWSWSPLEHPRVFHVLAAPTNLSDWPDALDGSTEDAITGKVVCVVVALAIAKLAINTHMVNHEHYAESIRLLELGENWIDDPKEDLFNLITNFLFDRHQEYTDTTDPLRFCWSALRVLTSSVGNFEAGWALSTLAEDVSRLRLDVIQISRAALIARAS